MTKPLITTEILSSIKAIESLTARSSLEKGCMVGIKAAINALCGSVSQEDEQNLITYIKKGIL